MSLIITYIGSNGSVIIGDRRRVGYFGDRDKREKLEDELYTGEIKNDDQLMKRAMDLGITLNITDDAEKVRIIEDVVVGEVKHTTTTESRRRRIYATTNGYMIIELTGSNIEKMQKGESSLIIFGNKITKKIANDTIQKHWKSRLSLNDIAEIFEASMVEVSKHTPSVGRKYNIYKVHPDLNKKQAQKILRSTIVKDVRQLQIWREKLKKQQIKTSRTIEMASKIINQGEIGRVTNIEGNKVDVVLNRNVQALNLNWEQVANPGETVSMEVQDLSKVAVGDLVVIEDENLCLKRTKSSLMCDVILCKI